MDAMRLQLVQQLGQYLRYIDSTLHRIRELGSRWHASKQDTNTSIHNLQDTSSSRAEASDDPYFDTDLEIVEEIGRGDLSLNVTKDELGPALLLTSSKADALSRSEPISDVEIENNRRAMKQVRDYLPQLVSAVLRSPPPFDPNLVDPVHRLRELMISRCQADPNWGIELCWLLEAEVGRTWKSLFEHRQQTGKRLIIVLPAEKAAVLAQIGPKKREAFDLLQDAERVTAYGYPSDHEVWRNVQINSPHGTTSRLPSSISLLRCSHFGDTMHFIDRLTQISLDLRMVPAIHRHVSPVIKRVQI